MIHIIFIVFISIIQFIIEIIYHLCVFILFTIKNLKNTLNMPRKFESCYNFFWYKKDNKNNTKCPQRKNAQR